jgi:hypothetical protein
VSTINLLKKYSFWLSVISILICLSDYLGSGFANIVLVRLNPLIDAIKFTDPYKTWMIDVHDTKWLTNSALISLRFPAYLIHLGTFLFLGIILDYFICTNKKRY